MSSSTDRDSIEFTGKSVVVGGFEVLLKVVVGSVRGASVVVVVEVTVVDSVVVLDHSESGGTVG